jgi:hypothetical protein
VSSIIHFIVIVKNSQNALIKKIEIKIALIRQHLRSKGSMFALKRQQSCAQKAACLRSKGSMFALKRQQIFAHKAAELRS